MLFTDRFYSFPVAVSMATFDLKFVHQGRSQQVLFEPPFPDGLIVAEGATGLDGDPVLDANVAEGMSADGANGIIEDVRADAAVEVSADGVGLRECSLHAFVNKLKVIIAHLIVSIIREIHHCLFYQAFCQLQLLSSYFVFIKCKRSAMLSASSILVCIYWCVIIKSVRSMQLELAATACFSVMILLDQSAKEQWINIFQIVASAYAALMLLKEKQLMDSGRDTFTAKVNSLISILGYFLFFVTAFLSGHYIEGKLFIGAAFFLTLSVMLKIINYITAKDRSGRKRQIANNPTKCLILACITTVNYCLFIAAACQSLALENNFEQLISVASVCSWLGVLAHGGWLYFVYLQQGNGENVKRERKQLSVATQKEEEEKIVVGREY